MQITVVSDTHNNGKSLEKILELSKKSDVIFHLGDNLKDAEYLEKNFHGKVYKVKGNCDYENYGVDEEIVDIEGKRFFLTHGHKYNVNYGLNKIYFRGLELKADCILYGHTHRKLLVNEEEVYIFNPGSISLPRDNSASIGYIKIENGQINFSFFEI